MHCPPIVRHSGVSAWAAILFPYETRCYDVIILSAFSSLPLVGLWTVRVRFLDRVVTFSGVFD